MSLGVIGAIVGFINSANSNQRLADKTREDKLIEALNENTRILKALPENIVKELHKENTKNQGNNQGTMGG